LRSPTAAVVLAGGIGARVGAEAPKQFLELNGSPVLVRTVTSVIWCDRVVVVHHPEYRDLTRSLLEHTGLASRVELVPGGSTRRQSVAAALEALAEIDDDVAIVLQNAASPNTPRELIKACLDGLSTHEVVVAYVPAVHTIFSHDGREVAEILPRSILGYTTDPTVYRLGCLRRIAAAQADGRSTGEMTIDTARALGIPVLMVPSPATNLKLTTSHDRIVLEAILAAEEGRSQARRDDA
jgi:2-C-methyl-D-erythritol 4-phosphate cytidylyltransferase